MQKNDNGDKDKGSSYTYDKLKDCLEKYSTNGDGELLWISRSQNEGLTNAPKLEHHNASASEEQQDTGFNAMSKKPFDPTNIPGSIQGFQISYPAASARIDRSARMKVVVPQGNLVRGGNSHAAGSESGIPKFCDITPVPKELRGGPSLFEDLPDLYDIYGM